MEKSSWRKAAEKSGETLIESKNSQGQNGCLTDNTRISDFVKQSTQCRKIAVWDSYCLDIICTHMPFKTLF